MEHASDELKATLERYLAFRADVDEGARAGPSWSSSSPTTPCSSTPHGGASKEGRHPTSSWPTP